MGYFSGPSVVGQWDARQDRFGGMRSRLMGQAAQHAQTTATKQALSQGMQQGPQLALGENIALANQARDRRFKSYLDETSTPEGYWRYAQSGGGGYGTMGPLGGDQWDAFFEALRGKHVNLGGFGRTVDYDVPTGKSYNRDAGEIAPGRRGSIQSYARENPEFAYAVTEGSGPGFRPSRGGFYTPGELGGMDRWQRAQIGYDNALGRIQRGY